MEIFLKEVARSVYNNHESILGDCGVLFPGRRAAVFFREYLMEVADEDAIWSPSFITINELMQEMSGLKIADPLTLLFELYDTYTSMMGQGGFDEFYYWGEMLLSDFDDIDKYLVNADDLFQNLAAYRELDHAFPYLTDDQVEAIKQFWESFNPGKYSEHQEEFVGIWPKLKDIYHAYREKLKEKGIAYEGMVYREGASLIKSGKSRTIAYPKIFIIGFNALNPAEEELFKYLNRIGIAEFYWDYDNYYLNQPHHEAGFFIRKNLPGLSQTDIPISRENFTGKNNINIVPVPGNTTQAKSLGRILENLESSNENFNNTAVVLGDENLLLPVLYSLPDKIKEVNITMGYPLSQTPVYSLVIAILDLHKNAKKSGKRVLWYHKFILNILHNPYVTSVAPQTSGDLHEKITRENRVYLSPEDFSNSGFLEHIFRPVEETSSLSAYLLDLMHVFFKETVNHEVENRLRPLQQEFIYQMYLTVNRLGDILNTASTPISIAVYTRLFRRLAQKLTVPFIGEPLAGLQVMGILETRALDFENLVILSMNEGTLPSTNAAPSYVPYSLRKGFGLPTIEHQDAIFAYYFYRLIQRAKNVYLLYNTRQDGVKTGEKSRYIYQLQYEDIFNVKENNIIYQTFLHQKKPITVHKNNSILQRLEEFTGTGDKAKILSPTALNTYLDCPLRFYFKYILKLKEKDTITEEIDPPAFGNILHHTMRELYGPYQNQVITSGIIDLILNDTAKISKTILDAYHDEFLKKSAKQVMPGGQNDIILDVITKYVNGILEFDKNHEPFVPVGLEENYQKPVTVTTNGASYTFQVGGQVDRIDEKKGTLRIIDYKTGSNIKQKFYGVESLFDAGNHDRNKNIFQLMLYTWVIDGKHKYNNLQPGLFKLTEIFSDQFDWRLVDNKKKLDDVKDILPVFEENLGELITEIMDKNVPFKQVENLKVCEYCIFKEICHR
jgi:hypothetical protein